MDRPPPKPDRTLDLPGLEGMVHHETVFGSQARSAFHWRLFAFVELLILGAVVVWFLFAMQEKQYVPVVIAEHEDGSMRFVGTPDPNWRPQDRHILAELWLFIQTTQGRTGVAKFDKKLWQRASDRSTEKGRAALGEMYKRLDAIPEKGRIDPQIISTNKTSDTVFDVRWTETRHDAFGTPVPPVRIYRGIFTWEVAMPTTLGGLQLNEIGAWFDGGSVGEEKN